MTGAPEAPTASARPLSSVERWLRLGLRARPWLHALAAYLAGVVLALIIPRVVLGAAVAGAQVIPYGLAVLGVAAGAFGGIGAGFQGRRGWWHAVASLLWFPVSIWACVSQWFGEGGELYSLSPGAVLFSGLAPAAFALLGHVGPPRVVAVLGAVAVVIAIAVPPIVAQDLAEQRARDAERERILAILPRPYVGDIEGYRRWGDGSGSGDGRYEEMHVIYRPGGRPEVDHPWIAYVVMTDLVSTDACGDVPLSAGRFPELEEEVSCELAGDTWERTSESAHEVARMVDGTLVRVSGPQRTPIDVLRAALDAATLMEDAGYERMLALAGG